MLKSIRRKTSPASGLTFAIVASKYNARYVDSMVRAARRLLRDAGAGEVEVIRVPGAYEIPVVAAILAARETRRYGAIICLGVILRGATSHAQHIGEAVSQALVQIQVKHKVAVIHEVLLLENEVQARERCLDGKRNRGLEAAYTAIAMARLTSALTVGKSAASGARAP